MYRNHEGYSDPTAGAAMGRMMKEYRQAQRQRFSDRNRRKVYVASAYAGDVEGNTEVAIRCYRQVIREGHMPVASHLLYPRMLNDRIPKERELGLSFGLALLKLCDEVWVYGKPSPGMKREIEEAERLHKPIQYREVPAWDSQGN